MERRCAYCGLMTPLYSKGIPVCLACAELMDAGKPPRKPPHTEEGERTKSLRPAERNSTSTFHAVCQNSGIDGDRHEQANAECLTTAAVFSVRDPTRMSAELCQTYLSRRDDVREPKNRCIRFRVPAWREMDQRSLRCKPSVL